MALKNKFNPLLKKGIQKINEPEIIKSTYYDLYDLVNNNNLKTGQLYQISDFITKQATSSGIGLDPVVGYEPLVVKATSTNTISNIADSILSTDIIKYDFTNRTISIKVGPSISNDVCYIRVPIVSSIGSSTITLKVGNLREYTYTSSSVGLTLMTEFRNYLLAQGETNINVSSISTDATNHVVTVSTKIFAQLDMITATNNFSYTLGKANAARPGFITERINTEYNLKTPYDYKGFRFERVQINTQLFNSLASCNKFELYQDGTSIYRCEKAGTYSSIDESYFSYICDTDDYITIKSVSEFLNGSTNVTIVNSELFFTFTDYNDFTREASDLYRNVTIEPYNDIDNDSIVDVVLILEDKKGIYNSNNITIKNSKNITISGKNLYNININNSEFVNCINLNYAGLNIDNSVNTIINSSGNIIINHSFALVIYNSWLIFTHYIENTNISNSDESNIFKDNYNSYFYQIYNSNIDGYTDDLLVNSDFYSCNLTGEIYNIEFKPGVTLSNFNMIGNYQNIDLSSASEIFNTDATKNVFKDDLDNNKFYYYDFNNNQIFYNLTD